MSTQTKQERYDISEYRVWLQEEHRYTDGTIAGYVSAARRLAKFLGDRELTLEIYREWIRSMIEEGMAPSTINTYHSQAIKFAEWLDVDVDLSRAAGELPDHDPNSLPEPLTREQVREMFDAAMNPEERYIVAILYHTALRNVEFCELRWEDIGWEKREVEVRRRKKKDWGRDTLPLYDFHMDVLDELREWRDDDNPYLLPASSGTVSPGATELRYKEDGSRSDRGLENRVDSIARRAGIERNVWPHLFRHTRLTHMLEEGREITEVNEWAAHDKIETTMRYARLTGETLREVTGADSTYIFEEEEADE